VVSSPKPTEMAELQGQMPKHPVADKENSTLCLSSQPRRWELYFRLQSA
jgi:hypothetical protein